MDKKLDLTGVRIYSNTDNDIKDAINLIGQEVYMSDDLDFENYYKNRLVGIQFIENYSLLPFLGYDGTEKERYEYFILCKDAKFKKEKEKVLRPFKSMREFFDTTGFDIGDVVHIKKETGSEYEETSIFNGFRIEEDKTYIMIGYQIQHFERLKEFFKYYRNGKWNPFGIEE